MEKQRRKDLVQAYRETRAVAGVYGLICAVTGQAWVGTSRNLAGQENSLRFSLKHGGHRNAGLQKAWSEQGEAVFEYRVLARIEDENLTPIGQATELKALEAHWREALGARPIVGSV
jgi:hypothetical protein